VRFRRTWSTSFGPGDQRELRGPLGGYFVWEASLGGPLLLLAGGSGVVPLRAIFRHHRVVESTVPARLLYWARALDDVIYRDELMANVFGLGRHPVHAHVGAAGGMAGVGAMDRHGASPRGHLAAARAPARLRVRTDAIR
jgi:ferredoxin-NADP reductase